MKHPPAHHREVLRALRDGAHPLELVDEAAAIGDPGHAAGALAALAADARVPAAKAAALAQDILAFLRGVDRPGRISEAWGDVVERLAERGGAAWGPVLADVRAAAVDAVAAMPDGTWTTDAIARLAPSVGPAGRQALLDRALANPGLEVEGAKAVLRAAPDEEGLWARCRAAPPEIAARLASFGVAHGAAVETALRDAWAIRDTTARHEALRVLAWNTDDADALDRIAASATGRPPADAVHVLVTVGAREDRLGVGDPKARFDAAAVQVARLEGRAFAKADRKLRQARERAGLDAGPPVRGAPDAPADAPGRAAWAEAEGPSDVQDPADGTMPAGDAQDTAGDAAGPTVIPGPRHVLALVDGYRSMGPPQVRAVARAAPLCAAFGLDLALVGFPASSAQLVDLVEKDSAVGEHGGHARALLDGGRIHDVPLHKGLPAAWPGHPVATTPHPEAGKESGLADALRPVCLLVGLGPKGLPKRMLHAVDRHHELTGHGISLETATAMGILADRLGRLA